MNSVLLEFHCKEEKSWKYNRQLILRCGKPIGLARKVFMRINANGVVSFERYRSGSSYAATSTSTWLPFHAMFFAD